MKLEKELQTEEVEELFEVIVKLKNKKEAKMFLRDIATIAEIKSLTERWQAAKLLDQDIPYREISKKIGSSTTTITRVAQFLHHGMGGYKLMLDRFSKK